MLLTASSVVMELIITQAFYPLLAAVPSVVRRKFFLIALIQITIYLLKELFIASGIGVRERAAPGDLSYADMMQLPDLCCHRCLYLTQRVETHDYSIEHCQQVSVAIKALNILLTAVYAAHFNNFITIQLFYQLTINRLSEKMCTFAHGYVCFF